LFEIFDHLLNLLAFGVISEYIKGGEIEMVGNKRTDRKIIFNKAKPREEVWASLPNWINPMIKEEKILK